MSSFPQKETSFLLDGPAGSIEVLITPKPETSKKNTTVIICHPHPLYGGTMHNKVVTTLAKTFYTLGLHTLRFNFRGVGQTKGVHDEGRGETEDVLALAHWVQKVNPKDVLWFAGFSFGGYVAARAATLYPCKKLITVAPQVTRFYTMPISAMTCPWIIIQGEKDEIIDPEEVYTWAFSLNPPPQLVRLPGAGHFFHGQLSVLQKVLQAALNIT